MDYDKVPWHCVLCPAALDVHDPVRVCVRRLCSGQVPTTVFTPMEYACIGATEEAAIAQEGEDNIEVYHVVHQPLEMAAVHRSAPDGTEDTVRARLFFVACVCVRACARAGINASMVALTTHFDTSVTANSYVSVNLGECWAFTSWVRRLAK